jgi:hypothetical protein
MADGHRIIPRSEWGARPPKRVHRISLPTPRLWIHHTAGNERGAAGMRSIQNFHMDGRDWADIAYSFVIDNDDGKIYEGRGAGIAGGHTQGDNTTSHAICVMGNFDNEALTTEAFVSIRWLAVHGKNKGWWKPTCGGHRDAPGANTACPGRNLYSQLPRLRSQLNVTEPIEDDDMTKDELVKALSTPGDPLRAVVADIFEGQRALIKKDTQDAMDKVLALYIESGKLG